MIKLRKWSKQQNIHSSPSSSSADSGRIVKNSWIVILVVTIGIVQSRLEFALADETSSSELLEAEEFCMQKLETCLGIPIGGKYPSAEECFDVVSELSECPRSLLEEQARSLRNFYDDDNGGDGIIVKSTEDNDRDNNYEHFSHSQGEDASEDKDKYAVFRETGSSSLLVRIKRADGSYGSKKSKKPTPTVQPKAPMMEGEKGWSKDDEKYPESPKKGRDGWSRDDDGARDISVDFKGAPNAKGLSGPEGAAAARDVDSDFKGADNAKEVDSEVEGATNPEGASSAREVDSDFKGAQKAKEVDSDVKGASNAEGVADAKEVDSDFKGAYNPARAGSVEGASDAKGVDSDFKGAYNARAADTDVKEVSNPEGAGEFQSAPGVKDTSYPKAKSGWTREDSEYPTATRDSKGGWSRDPPPKPKPKPAGSYGRQGQEGSYSEPMSDSQTDRIGYGDESLRSASAYDEEKRARMRQKASGGKNKPENKDPSRDDSKPVSDFDGNPSKRGADLDKNDQTMNQDVPNQDDDSTRATAGSENSGNTGYDADAPNDNPPGQEDGNSSNGENKKPTPEDLERIRKAKAEQEMLKSTNIGTLMETGRSSSFSDDDDKPEDKLEGWADTVNQDLHQTTTEETPENQDAAGNNGTSSSPGPLQPSTKPPYKEDVMIDRPRIRSPLAVDSDEDPNPPEPYGSDNDNGESGGGRYAFDDNENENGDEEDKSSSAPSSPPSSSLSKGPSLPFGNGQKRPKFVKDDLLRVPVLSSLF